MALIIGFLLLVMGVVACYAWSVEAVFFLKGLVAFSLLFWGILSVLVGYAGLKSKREVKAALNDGSSEEDVTD